MPKRRGRRTAFSVLSSRILNRYCRRGGGCLTGSVVVVVILTTDYRHGGGGRGVECFCVRSETGEEDFSLFLSGGGGERARVTG